MGHCVALVANHLLTVGSTTLTAILLHQLVSLLRLLVLGELYLIGMVTGKGHKGVHRTHIPTCPVTWFMYNIKVTWF